LNSETPPFPKAASDATGVFEEQHEQYHSSVLISQGFHQYEESESYIENDQDLLSVEDDNDFPLSAHNLILQQDSDLTTDDEEDEYHDKYVDANDVLVIVDAELNALSNSWSLTESINQGPLAEGVLIHPRGGPALGGFFVWGL
jgi:hypothetical protein